MRVHPDQFDEFRDRLIDDRDTIAPCDDCGVTLVNPMNMLSELNPDGTEKRFFFLCDDCFAN